MDKLTGKRIIIFGAGIAGKYALTYLGSRSVECFADNYKAGECYLGKRVISFDELKKIHGDYDLVVSLGRSLFIKVREQLLSAGISSFVFFHDLLELSDFESDPKLRALKDTHTGEKCFLIGNGPSLHAVDLDILHKNKVFSFGCNRVYKIFEQTNWRPDVYCVADPYALTGDMDIIFNMDIKLKLLLHPRYTKYGEDFKPEKKGAGEVLFYSHIQRFVDESSRFNLPRFTSSDPSRCVIQGYSVINVMIQWAAYMGFSEMYLLGVDNNYKSNTRKTDYLNDINHFSPDYIDAQYAENSKVAYYEPDVLCEAMKQTFEVSEAFSREHGFRIYNATRGGELEVFERVDFDSLF